MRLIILLLAALAAIPCGAFASANWPNEPASATQLFDCGFDNTTCNGQMDDVYHSSGSTLNTAQDATAPLSPPNVLRSTRPAYSTTGGCELHYYSPAGGAGETYVGFWWRTNPEYCGKDRCGGKLFFIRGRYQDSGNGVFYYILTSGAASGSIKWTTQTPNNQDQCPSQSGDGIDQCYANVSNVPIVVGNWYRIEVYIKASTCQTCRNGIVRWWITPQGGTPQLAGNYENFAYGPDVADWYWTETWDGYGHTDLPEANHYLDHLHISAPHGAQPPVYLVITSSLTSARTGTPYSATLSANGGTKPYTWFKESGNLPAGLSLSSNGVISGTPTCVGRSDFTIRVTDASAPALTATKSYSIITSGTSTACPVIGITTSKASMGQEQFTAKAIGGKVTFNLPVTSSAQYRLSVYDLAGKKVYEYASMGQKEISIAKTLKNGIYVAQFMQGTQWSVLRFSALN